MSIAASRVLAQVASVDSPMGLTFAHWCPGCRERHLFNITRPLHNGAMWSWNGSSDTPSFMPSMNIKVGPYEDPDHPEDYEPQRVCHYHLTDGVITYCADTTHALAGQSVQLPDYPYPV